MPFGWKVEIVRLAHGKSNTIDWSLWQEMGWIHGDHTDRCVEVSFAGVTLTVPETHLMVSGHEDKHITESIYLLQRYLSRMEVSEKMVPYLPGDLSIFQHQSIEGYFPSSDYRLRQEMPVLEKESSWPSYPDTSMNLARISSQHEAGKHRESGDDLRASIKLASNSDIVSHKFIDEPMDLDNHDDRNATPMGSHPEELVQPKCDDLTCHHFIHVDEKVSD
jgi:hypothetical protein